ncbi:MAG: deoxyguanosinetriphosphate triphosphohydrolase [Armatimonadota bacterium]|nr:deoxyguanosinetriphosphate triphosphohydrolase [Armatimonadota bacterium]
MTTSIRERTEHFEKEYLADRAMRASESAGRAESEPQDEVRTCFQRDRDRILHSKAFRRLMNKTQVFISPEGDHYRTRMTHTLEVSQIGRTVARALRLNEDLTEAIALGHDVGHPPFGHAGEDALDQAVRKRNPDSNFRHYEQSVRVLSVLENLNLTRETLAGIGGHSKGRKDLGSGDESSPSAEAAVVRIADRIAYLNHDLDDALRSGYLAWSDLPVAISSFGDRHSQRVGQMVTDLIGASQVAGDVRFSPHMVDRVNEMKEFLFEKFYLDYPIKFPDIDKAKGVVASLFEHYLQEYGEIQKALDYVSGMTDRFASRDYERLFMPKDWQD